MWERKKSRSYSTSIALKRKFLKYPFIVLKIDKKIENLEMAICMDFHGNQA